MPSQRLKEKANEKRSLPPGEKLFYSIGEVAELSGLKPHVIRYWEKRFRSISPKKGMGGKRLYREKDLQEVLTLKKLLYEEQYTLEGAKEIIRGLKEAEDSTPEREREHEAARLRELLREVRRDLEALRKELAG